jgi:hypothetical protein
VVGNPNRRSADTAARWCAVWHRLAALQPGSEEGTKELLYRKTIPEGSSFVIRTGKQGELPQIDVVKLSD